MWPLQRFSICWNLYKITWIQKANFRYPYWADYQGCSGAEVITCAFVSRHVQPCMRRLCTPLECVSPELVNTSLVPPLTWAHLLTVWFEWGHDREGRATRIMTLGPVLNLLERGGRQTAGFIVDKGGISTIHPNRSVWGTMQWSRKVGSSSCRPTTAALWDKGKLQDREERKWNGQKTVNQCELWNRPQTLNNLHSCPGSYLRTCDPYLCIRVASRQRCWNFLLIYQVAWPFTLIWECCAVLTRYLRRVAQSHNTLPYTAPLKHWQEVGWRAHSLQIHTDTCVCCGAISWPRVLPSVVVTDSRFGLFQHAMDAMSAGVSPSRDSYYNSSYWDVGSAFFFAGTVITTIGDRDEMRF